MAKRVVTYGAIAVVFVTFLGGWYADAMNTGVREDMKPGCHTDYYFWVIPAGWYCASIKTGPP